MSDESSRQMPADMLLVHERLRRMHRAAPAPDDQLEGDEDQLLDEEPQETVQAENVVSGGVILCRPMAQVSLAQISWSGLIDHDLLAEAIACYPLHAEASLAGSPLAAAAPFPLPSDGPHLEVTVRPDDISLLHALRSNVTSAVTFARVLRMPERLSGAQPSAQHALAAVLGAYRHASMLEAWQRTLGPDNNAQIRRERDEAAVALLSTLRALLGER